MEVYLIRHTSPSVEKGICYGQTDLDLAASFDAEKKAVLQKLPTDFDLVFTSPLKRCVQLAEAIANYMESDILKITSFYTKDERLQELHFGAWELQPWDKIPRQELDRWSRNYLTDPVPGGESFQDLKNRISIFWNELKKLHQGKKIAIVTHHGVIQTLLLLEDIIDEKALFSSKIPYGGVVHLSAPSFKNN